MAGNLTVNIGGVANATLSKIGGAGTPQNPAEWRLTNSAPVATQVKLLSFLNKLKGIDQINLVMHVPYVVTNTTTGMVTAARRAEALCKFNLPQDVPSSVTDDLLIGFATALYYNGVGPNLFTDLQSRRSGA